MAILIDVIISVTNWCRCVRYGVSKEYLTEYFMTTTNLVQVKKDVGEE